MAHGSLAHERNDNARQSCEGASARTGGLRHPGGGRDRSHRGDIARHGTGDHHRRRRVRPQGPVGGRARRQVRRHHVQQDARQRPVAVHGRQHGLRGPVHQDQRRRRRNGRRARRPTALRDRGHRGPARRHRAAQHAARGLRPQRTAQRRRLPAVVRRRRRLARRPVLPRRQRRRPARPHHGPDRVHRHVAGRGDGRGHQGHGAEHPQRRGDLRLLRHLRDAERRLHRQHHLPHLRGHHRDPALCRAGGLPGQEGLPPVLRLGPPGRRRLPAHAGQVAEAHHRRGREPRRPRHRGDGQPYGLEGRPRSPRSPRAGAATRSGSSSAGRSRRSTRRARPCRSRRPPPG